METYLYHLGHEEEGFRRQLPDKEQVILSNMVKYRAPTVEICEEINFNLKEKGIIDIFCTSKWLNKIDCPPR